MVLTDESSRIHKMIIIETVVSNCLCKCHFFHHTNVESAEYFPRPSSFVSPGSAQIESKDNLVLELENYIIVHC